MKYSVFSYDPKLKIFKKKCKYLTIYQPIQCAIDHQKPNKKKIIVDLRTMFSFLFISNLQFILVIKRNCKLFKVDNVYSIKNYTKTNENTTIYNILLKHRANAI